METPFEVAPSLRILICRECKWGVLPEDVFKHLHGKRHRLSEHDAEEIARTIRQWDSIKKNRKHIHIPPELPEPLPILPIHNNGLRCQRDPQCPYISTTMGQIERHWAADHQWPKGKRTPHEVRASVRRVCWQKVFHCGEGLSHPVHIKSFDSEDSENPDHFSEDAEEQSADDDTGEEAVNGPPVAGQVIINVSPAKAKRLFEVVPYLRIIICRKCKMGVLPKKVFRHLRGTRHRLSDHDAEEITRTILQWDSIEQDSQRIHIPPTLPEPLPILPIQDNGLKCRRDPQCPYISTTMRQIEKHWAADHQWPKGKRTPHEVRASVQRVCWQKVFYGEAGISRLVHIESLNPKSSEEPSEDPDRVSEVSEEHAVNELPVPAENVEPVPDNQVVQPEYSGSNDWQLLTSCAEYLKGVHIQDLVHVVAAPTESTVHYPTEQGVRAIWKTMDSLVRKCQRTVRHCNLSVRIEAMRTEESETPRHPLLADMDEDRIQQHIRPWQQILTFIARTQIAWRWRARRPKYGMTPRQKQKWKRLWQLAMQGSVGHGSHVGIDDNGLEGWLMSSIEKACLEFCVELLNQPCGANDFNSVLMCALAVLGRKELGWHDSKDYADVLSRVVKVARFMVVQHALWLDPNAREIIRKWQNPDYLACNPLQSPTEQLGKIGENSELLANMPNVFDIRQQLHQPVASCSQQSDHIDNFGLQNLPTFPEILKRMVRRLIVRGTHGPMHTLLDWLAYSSESHGNSARGGPLPMQDSMELMIRTFTNSPMQVLRDWQAVTDALEFRSDPTVRGHVSWKDEETLLYKGMEFTMVKIRGFVHDLIASTKKLLKGLLYVPETESSESRSAVLPQIPWDALRDDPMQAAPSWSFLKDERTVKSLEVNSERCVPEEMLNEQRLRQLFLRNGVFDAEETVRFFSLVSRFKEQLAICVLVTAGIPVRPSELLSLQHENPSAKTRRNIFIEDGMVALVTTFNDITEKKTIVRFLPREVGELVIWYLWLVLPLVRQLALWRSGVGQETTICSNQAPGQSLLNNNQHKDAFLWGPDPGTGREWTCDRINRVLQRETKSSTLNYALDIASYSDIAVGISRRRLQPHNAFPNYVRAELNRKLDLMHNDAKEWIDVMDVRDHDSENAGLTYAREIFERPFSASHRRAKFRACSADWHQLLGLESGGRPPSVLGKRVGGPFEEDRAEDNQQARQRLLRTTDMESAMKEMTGEANTRLVGARAGAMKAIKDGETPVVAVTAPGRGKSMLFMLPAWVAPGGTTVVVVPLLESRQSVLQCCQRFGIKCAFWESGRAIEDASIVMVTSKSAATAGFQSFLDRLHDTRRLDRIVVDECHAIVDNRNDFRQQLSWLERFIQARTQLVLLTTTLPPSLEDNLCEAVLHLPRKLVPFFRELRNQPKVSYCVWDPPKLRSRDRLRFNSWIQSRPVVEFIKRKIRWAGSGRIIVYANLAEQVRAIAQKLGCEALVRDDSDEPDVLSRFIDGTTRVLAARSGVGIGVDVKNVRCVIHIGIPRSLLVYAEEIAHVGLDGERSEAIIIRRPACVSEPLSSVLREIDGATAEDMELLENYMCGGLHRCLRSVLKEYLDGTKHERCLPGQEALCQGCDLTHDDESSLSDSSSSLVMRERRNSRRFADMLGTLDSRSRQRLRSSSVDSKGSATSTPSILSQAAYLNGSGLDSEESIIKVEDEES
ncbi:hypothetical protein VTN49DRAFT_2596 [Thermomyces lanuginosus]|uniref:uncharacterized protein n=1 Tax=Thermomyces lanuginosus TaxID=5541 RepID=UPI0037424F3A